MEMKKNKLLDRYAAAIKLLIIGAILLLLLIPTQMVRTLIGERQNRKNEVAKEITQKWGQTQYITGPILQVPFTRLVERQKKLYRETDYAYLLPENLNITGELRAEEKHRNIYRTVIYEGNFSMTGSFDPKNLTHLNIRESDWQLGSATMLLGLEDLTGIREQIYNKSDSQTHTFEAGVSSHTPIGSGLCHSIPIDLTKPIPFSISPRINGSNGIYFAPLGRVTTVHLTSNWTSPSFKGAFVTDTYQIDSSGFKANWKILDLNRNLPHVWKGNVERLNNRFSFGVELDEGVDLYQKTERSVKYAALILGLSFLSFFLFEIINSRSIHPVQYIFIGLVLVIFYSLLLSFAETVGFDMAYLISTSATIALIAIYSQSVLGTWQKAGVLAIILTSLYSFVYVILQLATYSLLFGSIGLFLFLGGVMLVSRRINWYETYSQKD